MIPVDQTQFVAVDGRGNCVQACVASILEIPLDQVPAFRDAPCMMKAMDDFLSTRALRRLGLVFGGGFEWGDLAIEDVHPTAEGNRVGGVPVLIFGQSPRNKDGHAVVGEFIGRYNWRIIHDPHPDRTGIAGDPKQIHFFVRV